MKKKTKIIIVIVIVVLLLLSGVGGYFYYKMKTRPTAPVKVVEVIDNVSNYTYELEDRDTEIYKDNFLKLKEVLEQEEIDYELYSSYVAKLFLIDLYTIDNKISKYDVGGVEFIYPSDQEKYKNKLIDTMYKLVLDNSSNTREQELPEVTDVIMSDATKTTYKVNEKNLASFEFTADIEYKKDLGYDKKVKLIVAVEDSYAYVVNLSPIK